MSWPGRPNLPLTDMDCPMRDDGIGPGNPGNMRQRSCGATVICVHCRERQDRPAETVGLHQWTRIAAATLSIPVAPAPFDQLLAPRHDVDSMRIRQLSL